MCLRYLLPLLEINMVTGSIYALMQVANSFLGFAKLCQDFNSKRDWYSYLITSCKEWTVVVNIARAVCSGTVTIEYKYEELTKSSAR